MRCEHCGAELPTTAMFCGECGSAVAPEARSAGTAAEASAAQPTADGSPRCAQCGAEMRITDIFCAECGHVARAVAEAYLTEPQALSVRTAPIVRTAPTVRSEQPPVEEPAPAPEMAEAAAPRPLERFVLQFSTGEQAQVSGSGLLGRNPRPEPGERFDHLVIVRDPGRSVSKTHLEFGIDDAALWVLDRYSGNGSVLHRSGQQPIRCEPGRRYQLARGDRVEIGEQFLIVD